MNKRKDTIFAMGTPSGKSAIAVIRISGQRSFDIINRVSSKMPQKANVATLNKIITNKYILL